MTKKKPNPDEKSKAEPAASATEEPITPEVVDEKTRQPVFEPEVEESSSSDLVPYDPLRRYLTEIRRYKLLTREEEHELAVRYKEEGDRDAARQLVTANLRLVVMIAREYQRAFRNLLDLIQEGNTGLLEAIKKFDPYRGIRFPSYAVWWVRAYIIRYIMNNWRMVKIGTTQAQRKLFFNLQKEKERLEAEGFTPGPKLLAQRLSVKESEIVEMEQRLSGRDLSVDAPVDQSEDATMLDFLPSAVPDAEGEFSAAESKDFLARKIHDFGEGLSGKERVIFESRLVAEDPQTLQEIGDQYGISRERVRQVEERIKKRLKEYLLRESPDLEAAVSEMLR